MLHLLGTVVGLEALHGHRTLLEEAQHVLQQAPVLPVAGVAEPAGHQVPAAVAEEAAARKVPTSALATARRGRILQRLT